MSSYVNKFAVCAIIKDESDILEWLAHYILLGFDHIYVYDNNSEPPITDTVAPLQNLTVIKWDGDQVGAYRHFKKTYGNLCEWTLFVDADEYLVIRRPEPSVAQLLENVPASANSIAVNWLMFDANGHYDENQRPNGLVTECYTNRAHSTSNGVKCMVRLDQVPKMLIHSPAGDDVQQFDVLGQSCVSAANITERGQELIEFATMHHYHTRSLAHWKARLARGQPNRTTIRTLDEFWAKQNIGRRVNDTFLQDCGWTQKLRAKMQEIGKSSKS